MTWDIENCWRCGKLVSVENNRCKYCNLTLREKMKIKPNSMLEYVTPDEIAECWDGVSESLQAKLWATVEEAHADRADVDIEECGPGDVVGLSSVVSVWGRFTDEEKLEINSLVNANTIF